MTKCTGCIFKKCPHETVHAKDRAHLFDRPTQKIRLFCSLNNARPATSGSKVESVVYLCVLACPIIFPGGGVTPANTFWWGCAVEDPCVIFHTVFQANPKTSYWRYFGTLSRIHNLSYLGMGSVCVNIWEGLQIFPMLKHTQFLTSAHTKHTKNGYKITGMRDLLHNDIIYASVPFSARYLFGNFTGPLPLGCIQSRGNSITSIIVASYYRNRN